MTVNVLRQSQIRNINRSSPDTTFTWVNSRSIGDLMVMTVNYIGRANDSSGYVWTPPSSGWTRAIMVTSGAYYSNWFYEHLEVWTKRATALEVSGAQSSSMTWSCPDGAGNSNGTLFLIPGATGVDILGARGEYGSASQGSQIVQNVGYTTSAAAQTVMTLACSDAQQGYTINMQSSGWTQRDNRDNAFWTQNFPTKNTSGTATVQKQDTGGTGYHKTVVMGFVENQPPATPASPSPNSGAIDRTAANTFSYSFSDPDSGQTQPSRTDWRWRTSPVNGTAGTWNNVTVSGTSTQWTAPANTFPLGRIEVQALPYDPLGVPAAAYSDSAFVTAADPGPAPSFTSPAAGSTINGPTLTATISQPNSDALQWRVLGDTSGAADTTKVVNAGATVEDPTARSFSPTGLSNNTTVHLQARTRYQGLWSAWADNGAQPVSFTPPPPPVVTLVPDDGNARMVVSWAIRPPTGSEPAVASIDVLVDDGTPEGLRRLATALPPTPASWTHRTPSLGREYSGNGRVVVVAVGNNGTSTSASA